MLLGGGRAWSSWHLGGQDAGYEPTGSQRAEAKAHKLRVIGTAAVIGMAKLKGLIPLARPLLYELRESGYHLSEAVIQAVLEDVGG